MRVLDSLRFRITSLFRRSAMNADLDEELRSHIQHRADDLERSGIPRVEAERRARIEFGGTVRYAEETREAAGGMLIESVLQDLRFAFRSLRRTAGLTAFVILTLSLGIGMTSGTFSMMDALIFNPYPVPHPGNVVTLLSTTHDSGYEEFSYREYLDIRDKTKSYDGVIANAPIEAVGFAPDPAATPRVRGGMLVSGNYFRVLGVEPNLGRGFRDDEDQVPGRDAVVVLGPDFWRHEFAGDPDVLGRTVRLNGKNFTVIGVAPDTFPGMMIFYHPDVYMPLAMAAVFSTNPQKNFFEDRDDRELTVRARLKSGTTLQQARNELSVIAQNFEHEYPAINRGRGAAVHTQFEMRTRASDVNWKFGVIFNVLALSVLLVACTNVAGLLLSRARARTREIAVRLAIGAGRLRLIRLLLTESLLLAIFGGLAGVAIAYGITRWFQSKTAIVFMTDLPAAIPFRLNTRVLIACLGLSLLSALACGLIPALQSTRTDLVNGLKSSEVDLPGRKRLWGRNFLVIAQISMSLMLLAASFLMARGFRHSVEDGTSFAKDHLLMASFDPHLMQYNAHQTSQFYKHLTDRLRQVPGVQNAGLMQSVPLGVDEFDLGTLTFVPEGFQMPRDRENFTSPLNIVDEGYFDTMGIAILRGRSFRESDTADAPRVAVVNEHFANHYWPHSDSLGKFIRLDNASGPLVQIVGIVPTIKFQNSFQPPTDLVHVPLAQNPFARMVLMVRSDADPLQLLDPVRNVVRTLDANMPLMHTMTYEDYYLNKAVKGPGIAIDLVGSMGASGLLLAIAGLYGVVAYNVSRRTREIGIRIALGAAKSDVLRLILGKGLALVGIGATIGLLMGIGVERILNAALFNSGGIDAVVYAIVVPSLILITTLAAYVPARKASQIAPTQALRYE